MSNPQAYSHVGESDVVEDGQQQPLSSSYSRYSSDGLEGGGRVEIRCDHHDDGPGVPSSSSSGERGKWLTFQQTLGGVLIVLGVSVSWVSSTQFAQSTFSPTFNAPFVTMWFSTTWNVLLYPLMFIPVLLNRKTFTQVSREAVLVFGASGLTVRSFFMYTTFFGLLWSVANYSYVRALGYLAATDVSAIFSSNNAFVYVLAFFLLKDKVLILKVLATIFSILGMVMMAYSDGFQGTSIEGALLCIVSALAAALYKVMFKRLLGDATFSQVSLFLTMLGVFNFLFLWPVSLVLYYCNQEFWNWNDMPWDFLCGTALLGTVFNLLVNFGIAVTHPLYVSVGIVIGIPMNAIVDNIWHDKHFSQLKIIATVFIVVGFMLMCVPPDWQQRACQIVMCQHRRDRSPADGADTPRDAKRPLTTGTGTDDPGLEMEAEEGNTLSVNL